MRVDIVLVALILLVSIVGLVGMVKPDTRRKKTPPQVEIIHTIKVVDESQPRSYVGGYARAYGNTSSTDGPQVGELMGVPVLAGALKTTNDRYSYPFMRMNSTRVSDDYFKPYGPNAVNSINFISSVNSFAPFREVGGSWEKIGLFINQLENGELMNAYRRPISPQQDLFEYTAQTKEGFVIRLEKTYLEDGDVVSITGKPGLWRLKSYINDKYILM